MNQLTIYYFDLSRFEEDLDRWDRLGTPNGARNYDIMCPVDHMWNHYFAPMKIWTRDYIPLNLGVEYLPMNNFLSRKGEELQDIIEIDNNFLFKDSDKLYLWTSIMEKDRVFDQFYKRFKMMYGTKSSWAPLDTVVNRLLKLKQLNII